MANPTTPATTPAKTRPSARTALAGVAFGTLGLILSSAPRTTPPVSSAEEIRTDVAATCDPEPIDFRQCHANFPTGCTDSQNPNYDAYLNDLKNRTGPFLGEDNPRILQESDYKDFESKTPPKLDSRNHATFKPDLTKLGEGEARAVAGYLYYVEVTGAESSNCKLTGEPNVDFHIGIGFQKPSRDLSKPDAGLPTKAEEQSSVVVEMTPHTRPVINPGWTSAALQSVRGKFVKVVGQLLVHNEHNITKDNCGLPGAKATCWRLSAWELHPVTKFLVCKTDKCDARSPDSDFNALGSTAPAAAPTPTAATATNPAAAAAGATAAH